MDKIIVGHTIFKDITQRYDGRVVTVNVSNKANREAEKGMGILIDGDDFYVIYTNKAPVRIDE